jgi:hypothetical protein
MAVTVIQRCSMSTRRKSRVSKALFPVASFPVIRRQVCRKHSSSCHSSPLLPLPLLPQGPPLPLSPLLPQLLQEPPPLAVLLLVSVLPVQPVRGLLVSEH